MTYSCSDFADGVVDTLVALGEIKGANVPADDPEGQANLVIPAIYRMHRSAVLADRELAAAFGAVDTDQARVEAAMVLMRKARTLLKQARARKTLARVRAALKSVDGARRNARSREIRSV